MCVFLWLLRCLFGRFNYEGLVPHIQYFAGIWLQKPSCASYVLNTHDVTDYITSLKSSSNLKIAISWLVFSYSVETNIVMICGSCHIFLAHSILGFGYNDRQRSKIETVFGNSQIPCYAHDSSKLTSYMKTKRQIVWDFKQNTRFALKVYCGNLKLTNHNKLSSKQQHNW